MIYQWALQQVSWKRVLRNLERGQSLKNEKQNR